MRPGTASAPMGITGARVRAQPPQQAGGHDAQEDDDETLRHPGSWHGTNHSAHPSSYANAPGLFPLWLVQLERLAVAGVQGHLHGIGRTLLRRAVRGGDVFRPAFPQPGSDVLSQLGEAAGEEVVSMGITSRCPSGEAARGTDRTRRRLRADHQQRACPGTRGRRIVSRVGGAISTGAIDARILRGAKRDRGAEAVPDGAGPDMRVVARSDRKPSAGRPTSSCRSPIPRSRRGAGGAARRARRRGSRTAASGVRRGSAPRPAPR